MTEPNERRGARARVAMAAAEAVPFAKVGGLGDVVGSVPLALRRAGADVVLILPHYGSIDPTRFDIEATNLTLTVTLAGRSETFTISRTTLGDDVPVILLGNARLFGDPRVYIDVMDRERFFFFSRAVPEALRAIDFRPDVLHAHDWHLGMSIVWLRALRARDPWWRGTGSVFTIHNLAHQGITDVDYAVSLGYEPGPLLEVEEEPLAKYPGKINVLARAIALADVVTTVSPRYALEIQTPEYGEGLDSLLRQRASDLYGIVNGIDLESFDPARDPQIAAHYARDDLAGKAVCKLRLQEEAEIEPNPRARLIGAVSRLDNQKGFDLVVEAIEPILAAGAQFVLLGTGLPRYHEVFEAIAERYPRQTGIFLTFDAALAQRIYAGSDIFLMPSRFEPCGLGQMIAMRYGTIPVVRKTGGLADTVREWDPATGTGNGFVFADYAAAALVEAVERALGAYRDSGAWARLVRNAMSSDFSWARSADAYLRVYEAALRAAS